MTEFACKFHAFIYFDCAQTALMRKIRANPNDD